MILVYMESDYIRRNSFAGLTNYWKRKPGFWFFLKKKNVIVLRKVSYHFEFAWHGEVGGKWCPSHSLPLIFSLDHLQEISGRSWREILKKMHCRWGFLNTLKTNPLSWARSVQEPSRFSEPFMDLLPFERDWSDQSFLTAKIYEHCLQRWYKLNWILL